eukprot:CAMPEP_0116559570 /NCGR_PEP_ID=MMETSP0397-20121206/10473_1 /TAXON_ID=216820 /ORGANISM="Cyclophora tenuis, Strain ECT3854" /LENGTH=76 /DNA_ID=CAMNT_0004085361 /DNA_START=177 /DNA_END=404 /DNA_ORIENTATION=-
MPLGRGVNHNAVLLFVVADDPLVDPLVWFSQRSTIAATRTPTTAPTTTNTKSSVTNRSSTTTTTTNTNSMSDLSEW